MTSAREAFNLPEDITTLKTLLAHGQSDALELTLRGRDLPESHIAALHYEVGMTADKNARRQAERLRDNAGREAREQLRDLRISAYQAFAAASDMAQGQYIYAYRAGVGARRLGLYEDAGRYIDRAVAIEPRNAYILTERAKLHVLEGDNIKAITVFKKALEITPYDRVIAEELARLGVKPLGARYHVNRNRLGGG